MRNTRATQVVPQPAPPPINAKFKDRLPDIMADIFNELIVIEPAVDRLNIHFQELFDYLNYEIKKVDLDLKVLKWESKSDPAVMQEKEAWLKQLQQFKTDFTIDVMTSPPKKIRAMVDQMQKMFGV